MEDCLRLVSFFSPPIASAQRLWKMLQKVVLLNCESAIRVAGVGLCGIQACCQHFIKISAIAVCMGNVSRGGVFEVAQVHFA